jgi:hypothetical protein
MYLTKHEYRKQPITRPNVKLQKSVSQPGVCEKTWNKQATKKLKVENAARNSKYPSKETKNAFFFFKCKLTYTLYINSSFTKNILDNNSAIIDLRSLLSTSRL